MLSRCLSRESVLRKFHFCSCEIRLIKSVRELSVILRLALVLCNRDGGATVAAGNAYFDYGELSKFVVQIPVISWNSKIYIFFLIRLLSIMDLE